MESIAVWSAINLDHKSTRWVDLCIKRGGGHHMRLNASVRRNSESAAIWLADLFSQSGSIRLRLLRLTSDEIFQGDVPFQERRQDTMEFLLSEKLQTIQPHLTSLELFNHQEHHYIYEVIFLNNQFMGGHVRLTHPCWKRSNSVPCPICHCYSVSSCCECPTTRNAGSSRPY